MDESKYYLSLDKKESLEKELQELKGPKRQEILDTLAFAKGLGDLSENAEYHQARDEQAKLEEKISSLENILRNSVIIEKGIKGEVSLGSKIKLKKKSDKSEREFTLVGEEEADMSLGMLSFKSPLGHAVLGKKKGDKVVVSTPQGEQEYAIISIS
ncbi:transcription elongation factor GreA [Candidatus Nomurabacteria bacterium]|nr:transcription elongation factor GreA [Candidatus Nomurabacteria bacterium]USN95030.1 MAG: transcription elongation factor GreA [Candidatus Nomurabacteria bacterium]